MNLLLDVLGSEARSPDVNAAVAQLASNDESERGAIFTRPEVVEAILDLTGYTIDQPLHELRLLEPSFGNGDFLLPAVERLLKAWLARGGSAALATDELADSIKAVELHRGSFEQTRAQLQKLLAHYQISADSAKTLFTTWLVCDDFLLTDLPTSFDVIAGNPPYVRQERIPPALLHEYRSRYRTLYDRADIYIPFHERALDLLAPNGVLGFICANRWLKNKYGGPLREKIARDFLLEYFIDMEASAAFHSEVIAYPAITVIRNSRPPFAQANATRVVNSSAVAHHSLASLAEELRHPTAGRGVVSEVFLRSSGTSPWLLDDIARVNLLRRIEDDLPTLEQAGCKIGIGVATGCDRVFIAPTDELPVESARKLPLVMARDLRDGEIQWSGNAVLNPFEPDGRLASLEEHPRFAAYLHANFAAVAGRHVATKNKASWYRTIDRIYPELVARPKLLIPDIKGEATFVMDDGHYYPHHNLYFITSGHWDLRALQAVLRSSVTIMTVATYCTRMAGGFLRFQAQYLRRIRIPKWDAVSVQLRNELVDACKARSQEEIDGPVFELYGLTAEEAQRTRQIARAAQVTRKSTDASQ